MHMLPSIKYMHVIKYRTTTNIITRWFTSFVPTPFLPSFVFLCVFYYNHYDNVPKKWSVMKRPIKNRIIFIYEKPAHFQ